MNTHVKEISFNKKLARKLENYKDCFFQRHQFKLKVLKIYL